MIFTNTCRKEITVKRKKKESKKRVKKGTLHVGCSGWNYNHWKGLFYAQDSSSEDWFREYSSRFSTVEINNTFYQLPKRSIFKKWHDQAAPGFIFAVKANRFITHMKKLKEPDKAVKRFLDRAFLLKEHLGPVLFQLPPHWRMNTERLERFTDALPGKVNSVFEFRDSSWYDEKIYRILDSKNMSMCLHDMRGSESPLKNCFKPAYPTSTKPLPIISNRDDLIQRR